MPPKILFFPVSMPDETLQSRIARYHLLSGNKTEAETFSDIFGSSPFSLQIIPKKIEDLAERLPGDKEENLLELLNTNTIFPVYKPFIGVLKNKSSDAVSIIDEVARVPRREVSLHSMAKICISCVSSDLLDAGFSYWHRAHHIPGVTACWKHGEMLLQACPECSHPFYRANKLLPCLTSGCICGWSPFKAEPSQLATEVEKKLAIFAKDLLHKDIPALSSDVLIASYRRRAKNMGFRRGTIMATTELFNSIVSHFGPEVLSKIDRAFASGKHHQWIRTSTIGGVLDMPIARHLIISNYLFSDVESFVHSLSEELLLYNAKEKVVQKKSINAVDSKKRHLDEK
ncbi:TniQ family protein [Pseudomonas sp. MPFS]|uniref:TnsD family Tn7-like transposition protein n=1 Tax=Pseudomonas sp. MPFS TaxID=2795724 RepID=UPI001F1367D4|nr:TnsD family Tn7-like transposition protein [Pseudomonas sp. MPFS]UMZ12092.1 TniQ family protein [Pseudomonas sp. MPFS]